MAQIRWSEVVRAWFWLGSGEAEAFLAQLSCGPACCSLGSVLCLWAWPRGTVQADILLVFRRVPWRILGEHALPASGGAFPGGSRGWKRHQRLGSSWSPLTPWMAQHSLDSLPPTSLLTHVDSPRALALPPGRGGKGLSQVLPGGEALGSWCPYTVAFVLWTRTCVPDGQSTFTKAIAATGLWLLLLPSCPPSFSPTPHIHTTGSPQPSPTPKHVLLESDVDIVMSLAGQFEMMSLAGQLVDPATDLVCSECV